MEAEVPHTFGKIIGSCRSWFWKGLIQLSLRDRDRRDFGGPDRSWASSTAWFSVRTPRLLLVRLCD
jgi:hypothetical protein